MSITRIRSAVAMRIVRLDRQKFNEAVAAGHYPCAPPTTMGSARIFNEVDLIPLFVFARMLEMNVSPSRAGYLACEFKYQINSRSNKNSSRIVYVRGMLNDMFIGSEHWDKERDHDSKGLHYPGLGPVVLTIDFCVSTIRKLITKEIEKERSILGVEGRDD